MPSVEELLSQNSENEYINISPINDIITIDPETRTINLPASETLFGTEQEMNVERKYFKCPKIVGDNIDLSKHQIYITYVTAKDNTGTFLPEEEPGLYYCEDMAVDGDYITFSWLLSGNVLRNHGFIAFAVSAKHMDGEVLKTRWKTKPAVGMVLLTVPDGEAIEERYPDIITQLLDRMNAVEEIATEEAMQGYVNDYLGRNPVQLDPTLTDSTKAAPADLVGELKGDLDEISEVIFSNSDADYEVLDGYFFTVDGGRLYQIEDNNKVYSLNPKNKYVLNAVGGNILRYGVSTNFNSGAYVRDIVDVNSPHAEIQVETDRPRLVVLTSSYVTSLTIEKVDNEIDKTNERISELENSIDEFKYAKVDLQYENGTFDGYGTDADSERSVRVVKRIGEVGKNLIVTFPTELKCSVNFIRDDGTRYNVVLNASFMLKDLEHTVRIGFIKADDSSLQSDFLSYKDKIVIYSGKSKTEHDITIAPSDASAIYKSKADIVLNGENDTDIIQAVFCCDKNVECYLYGGTYNINSLHITKHDKRCAFSTREYDSPTDMANIKFIGQSSLGVHGRPSFLVSKKVYDSIGDNETVAIFLTPRADDNETSTATYRSNIYMSNINIQGIGINKGIVYMDFLSAKYAYIDFCRVHAQESLSNWAYFPSEPHEESCGIRVGHGSWGGAGCAVKHCIVWYCYTAYSICGEHLILEDNLAHHNYVGFAFGDKPTQANYEHPNVMIGCSIEHCKRLMTLNRYGAEPTPTNNRLNTLICIGLSTELVFHDPVTNTDTHTLPILEISKKAYRGRIEADWIFDGDGWDTIFEEGSGTRMQTTLYTWNGTIINGVNVG